MAQTANADGPIVFFTKAGTQIAIPVTAITFDDDDQIQVDRPPDGDSAQLASWLKYLVDQKRITRAAAPPAGAAMVVTAAVPGTDGNRIEVKVEPTPNQPAKVDVTVTETDVYVGLTLDAASPRFIGSVLGITGGSAGTKASLVRVNAITGTPPDPDEGAAVPVTPVVGDVPTFTVLAPAPTTGTAPASFTLAARGTKSDAPGEWSIAVSDIEQPATGPKTFTLTVTWKKTVRAIATAADLDALPGQLEFAVTIAKPPDAPAFKLPKPGTFVLEGGADPAAAKKASRTVPAKA